MKQSATPMSVGGAHRWLRRRGYVFLISHMRSYSSVLAHVLGGHGEISGYLEAGLSYQQPADLAHLGPRLVALGVSARHRLLLDKLLHNSFMLGAPVLADSRVRLVFFVRRPLPTLASIGALGKLHTIAWYQDPTAVTAYYCERLRAVADMARVADCPRVWFEAERLTQEPEPVLAGLTRFLGLREPLSSTYAVQARTGEPGFGDPSALIREGRILSPATSPIAPVLTAHTAEQLERGEAVYARTLDTLRMCVPPLR